MLKNKIYYSVKPLVPRRLQIAVRSWMVQRKRQKYAGVWPIDERASKSPEGWTGWPEGKRFALVLTHDVDTAKGHENCLKLMHLEKETGFRSSFNFVAEKYPVSSKLRKQLTDNGFEIGVHGLFHDGKYYESRETFRTRAARINHYLREWNSVGFRSPSMQCNLDWIHDLDIEYDASTFDIDPFEPQPSSVHTIFPFYVNGIPGNKGYVELPYTLPQDFTLYVLMREENIDIWKRKLDWIAENGGMALVITHPDYMSFGAGRSGSEEYPAEYYREFLEYARQRYEGRYWHALPGEMAGFCRSNLKDGKVMETHVSNPHKKKIWIDLDNSPHVPFFKPIIQELRQRGYTVVLTARDCFQTCGLADHYNMEYKRIGKHYGKNKLLKVLGLVVRSMQLLSTAIKEKPDLALSHGSRSQVLTAALLNMQSAIIADYEHAKEYIKATWGIVPELIPDDSINFSKCGVLKYPGIKEDVYVPSFKPDENIKKELGLFDDSIIVTVRPPATEAHYHNPESELLFKATIEFLKQSPGVQIVLLPRNKRQEEKIREEWPDMFADSKMLTPQKVVDGLNLIWYSDLVISGGGTMNREAAALGVPVYSIFRGRIGAIDKYLAEKGRLILIESVESVKSKIKLLQRHRVPAGDLIGNRAALMEIVAIIEKAAERIDVSKKASLSSGFRLRD